MSVIELRFKGRIFIVPNEPITPIMIYQRYGNYYLDLEGWEVQSGEDILRKERFSMTMEKGEFIQLEVKELDQTTISKLMMNNADSPGYFSLTKQDTEEALYRFYALEELLKNEGLIN